MSEWLKVEFYCKVKNGEEMPSDPLEIATKLGEVLPLSLIDNLRIFKFKELRDNRKENKCRVV